MKTFLNTLVFLFSVSVFCNPVGESATYKLNDDSERSTWLIKSGSALTEVAEYKSDSEHGPGYVVNIDYEIKIMFRGTTKGSIGLLIPEQVFDETFYTTLEEEKTMSLGTFDIDYISTVSAKDADDNNYEQCTYARIYNIDPSYQPSANQGLPFKVLWNLQEGAQLEVEDLNIHVKVNEQVPVIGAVQLDVRGKSRGVSFKAGFDYLP